MSLKNQRIFLATLAVLSITALEGYALHKGIDGAALSASIGGIGLILGYFWKK